LARASGQPPPQENSPKEEEEKLPFSSGDDNHRPVCAAEIEAQLLRIGREWVQEVAEARHPGTKAAAVRGRAKEYDELWAEVREALAMRGLWILAGLNEEVPLDLRTALFSIGLTQKRKGRANIAGGIAYAVRGYANQVKEERRLRALAEATPACTEVRALPAFALGDDAWGRACERFRGKISESAFRTWLGPTQLQAIDGEEVRVWTPNPYAAEWIAGKYTGPLQELLAEELGRAVKLTVAFSAEPLQPVTAGS
jgi:hypothetical protein